MLLYWVCCDILGLLLSMHLIAFTITIYVLCCSGLLARTSPLLFVAVVGAKQWRVSRGSSSSSSRCRWSHACRDRQKYSSTSSKTFTYFRRVGLLRRVQPSSWSCDPRFCPGGCLWSNSPWDCSISWYYDRCRNVCNCFIIFERGVEGDPHAPCWGWWRWPRGKKVEGHLGRIQIATPSCTLMFVCIYNHESGSVTFFLDVCACVYMFIYRLCTVYAYLCN